MKDVQSKNKKIPGQMFGIFFTLMLDNIFICVIFVTTKGK